MCVCASVSVRVRVCRDMMGGCCDGGRLRLFIPVLVNGPVYVCVCVCVCLSVCPWVWAWMGVSMCVWRYGFMIDCCYLVVSVVCVYKIVCSCFCLNLTL